MGIFDQDISVETVLKFPELYISGRLNLDLRRRRMIGWVREWDYTFHANLLFDFDCCVGYCFNSLEFLVCLTLFPLRTPTRLSSSSGDHGNYSYRIYLLHPHVCIYSGI